uniref:Uncharacterized protein n=1 Tax=Strigamia maritima TaxID=126957 RepID=T1J4L2_STRMM
MDIKNRMIASNDFFASVLVHPLATPALMGSTDLIEVETDRSAKASSCVNNDDVEWRKKVALYNNKTPYIYSTLACEETCAQMMLQWGHRPESECLRAEGPVTDEILKDDSFPSFCDSNGATDLLGSSNYSCNCPLACKENYPKKSVISMSGLNLAIRLLQMAYKNMIKLNNTGIKGAEKTFVLHDYNSSMIRVMYESPQVEIIVEENKYSVADFLGIIGGNLGLWVGLCLLSCIEVVENGNYQIKKKKIITEPDRIRTCNLLIRSQTRYPLRYRPYF